MGHVGHDHFCHDIGQWDGVCDLVLLAHHVLSEESMERSDSRENIRIHVRERVIWLVAASIALVQIIDPLIRCPWRKPLEHMAINGNEGLVVAETARHGWLTGDTTRLFLRTKILGLLQR